MPTMVLGMAKAKMRHGKIGQLKTVGVALLTTLALSALVVVPMRDAHAQLTERLQTHFDIFAGKNSPGPYTLTWNTIRTGKDSSCEVIVDGQTLKAEAYTIDAAKGQVSFKTPLSAKSVARVTYKYDPKAAKRNASTDTSPLSVPVTRFGQNTLQLIALPNGDATKAGATPLVWSIGGKTNLMGGGVTTEYKYAGGEKSGVKLGFDRGNERNGLSAQYSRADKEFAKTVGKALGMGDATQRMAYAARFAPSKYLGTFYNTTDTANLVSNEKKAQDVYGLKLGGVGAMPSLNYTRTADETVGADKKELTVTTDKVDVAARFDKMNSMTATSTQTTNEATDKNADTSAKDATFTLTSSANGGAKQATASLNTGAKETKTTMEMRRTVSVRLQPAPIFIVSAGQTEQKTTPVKADGTTGAAVMSLTQTATAEIVPMAGTKVTSSLAETTSNDVKVSSTNFTGQVGAGKKVEITTGVTNRSSEAPGSTILDTTRTQIALRPLPNLTLTGICTWNPEDNGVVRQALRQEVGFTATSGNFDVGSSYMLTTLNGVPKAYVLDPQFGLVSVSLGMRLGKFTKMSGSYKDSLRYRSVVELAPTLLPQYFRSYGMGFTHDLGSALNLALGGSLTEDRSKGNVPTDIKAEAKLGVRF